MSEFPGIPFPFRPPTEEELEKMQDERDKHDMSLVEFRHSFQRMFEELDENQSSTLQTMFHVLADNDESRLASYWEGIIAWERKKRFGICTSCGVNHDDEILEQPSTGERTADAMEATRPQMETRPAEAGFAVHDDGTLDIPIAIRKTMDEYHIDDAYAESQEGYKFIGFKCTGINGAPKEGCGVFYPTIQDRMLKEPEECSGCFIRIQHG